MTLDAYETGVILTRSRKRNTKATFIVIIFFIVAAVIFVTKFFRNSQPAPQETHRLDNNQILSTQIPTTESSQNNVKGISTKALLQKIEEEISDTTGTFSIYIYDINNKKGFGINEKTNFNAASVNKISILAALYHLVENGEIDLEKVIVPQPKDIQDYGTGSIQYDPPGTPYSIRTLARLMMEKSDNTAAYLLGTHIVGLKPIQELVDSWGLLQTNMKENSSSAYDMALLLIMMYKGEITNEALTAEMLGFMDKSDFDDRIPAGLPEEVKFYHKTGDEIGKIHDVGIIDLPKRPYFLAVLTTDMTNDEGTKKKIAKISRLVYEYMSSL